MFHTYPEAELASSGILAPNLRTWDWMELAINIPIYLVHVEYPTQEIMRQFLFGDIRQVIEASKQEVDQARIGALYMLCPEYMTNSQNPELVEIAEVWGKVGYYSDLLHITSDGRRLRFCLQPEPAPENEMECLLALKRGGKSR